MAKRRIHVSTYNSETKRAAIVYWNSELQEAVVKFYLDDKYIGEAADYFDSSSKSAIQTADHYVASTH